MRVFSFSKVIYDGYLSIDLMFFIIKLKPRRLFSFLTLIPDLIKYLLKMINSTKLANHFYEVLLSNLTVSDLNLFKVSNIHKLDLGGFGVGKEDLIITGEPAFLLELFINRNQYNCLCTEYDLRNREIIGGLNMGNNKILNLKKYKINHINQLFIYNFRDKALMKMADYILVYRDHEVIDYDQYEMRLKDMILYNSTNKKWLSFLILSLATMVLAVVSAEILTIFLPLLEAFLIGFFLWICVTYYLTTTFINEQPFNFDNIVGYIIGIIPNFLTALLIVLSLGVFIGFNVGIVMLLAGIISFPMLIFVLRFYKFD
ncbi:hypothetical protein [Mycoplasma sp. P36-A1]|uniref:hypothetical protein n=1 Tax=Mycoplasma sp. P36-A1 TaxID=3252900 RepID=UPI003C2F3915